MCWIVMFAHCDFMITFQFSLVQSCLTLCDSVDCSIPGFLVHHQSPLEFAQTHVHWVRGGIQPSHPLSSPSPPAFSLSQHQGLFQWVSSQHQVANEHPGLISFRMDWLDNLAVQGLSRVFSSTTVLKHWFFSTQLLYSPTLTSTRDYWKNHSLA